LLPPLDCATSFGHGVPLHFEHLVHSMNKEYKELNNFKRTIQ